MPTVTFPQSHDLITSRPGRSTARPYTYRKRYFLWWSRRHPYTRNANGTVTIPKRDEWSEQRAYRDFLFKGHGKDVEEPPVATNGPVGEEYDDDIFVTPSPSPPPTPTPTPAAGKKGKKKVVVSSEDDE